jgi:glycine C-acetyltransferase
MLGDAVVAQQMSERLLELGIYAIGFFYPVVPQGKARIRVQISAGHTRADLDKAVSAFSHAYKEMSL